MEIEIYLIHTYIRIVENNDYSNIHKKCLELDIV